MLPLVVLAILCGASVAQYAQMNAQMHSQMHTQVQANPQVIMNYSPQLLQHLISTGLNAHNLKHRLLNLPLEGLLKTGVKQGGSGGFLGGIPIIGGLVNNLVGNILGVRIKNVELLRLDVQFDETQNHIFVTIPADVEVELHLPLRLGRLIHLKLYLDIRIGVKLFRDPRDGLIKLVLGDCQNNPGHLRITVLDNSGPLFQAVNNLLRTVTNVLEKTVPHLLQKELCPIANEAVQTVLNLLQGSISPEVHGETIHLSSSSATFHDGVMQLGYQGSVRLPGGQMQTIPPISKPLPNVPLGSSSMNMLLSDHLLNVGLGALLPPQAINIDGEQEIVAFSHQMATVPGAVIPTGTMMRRLQLAYGTPALSLTTGKIRLLQEVELRVYGDLPHGGYQQLLGLNIQMIWHVAAAVDGWKLRTTLSLERINQLSLSHSLFGNFDVRHLSGTVSHLLSSYLLPHENHLLAPGFPLPMAQNLGVSHLSVASGQDALLLYVPPDLESGQPSEWH